MVSFWPWRTDPSSPASFEKTLSALSEKITNAQAHLDSLRLRGRRIRGLATLYLMLAYLLYTVVALLVIGQQNMGPLEWTGLAGGPVVVYTTRQLVAAFFNWRIESATTKLQAQQVEREKTIQKLKDATKYDSTLELLEKYGGGPKKERAGVDEDGTEGLPNRQSLGSGFQQQRHPQARTGIAPPATANIQQRGGGAGGGAGDYQRPITPNLEPTAEFAPNADVSPSQMPAQGPIGGVPPGMTMNTNILQHGGGAGGQAGRGGVMPQMHGHPSPQFTQYENPFDDGPHWYDRFLDLLLGEDEMAPRNRIVLICGRCRLVNGQAPAGTKTLGEVGTWKCMGCGNMNGEVDEGRRILRELMKEKESTKKKPASSGKGRDVVDDGSEGSSELVEVVKEEEYHEGDGS